MLQLILARLRQGLNSISSEVVLAKKSLFLCLRAHTPNLKGGQARAYNKKLKIRFLLSKTYCFLFPFVVNWLKPYAQYCFKLLPGGAPQGAAAICSGIRKSVQSPDTPCGLSHKATTLKNRVFLLLFNIFSSMRKGGNPLDPLGPARVVSETRKVLRGLSTFLRRKLFTSLHALRVFSLKCV